MDQSGAFAVGGLGVVANLGRPATTSAVGTLYFGMILESNSACAFHPTLAAYTDPGYTNQVLKATVTSPGVISSIWIKGPAGIAQDAGGINGFSAGRIALELAPFQWNASYYYQFSADCGDQSRSATFAANASNTVPFFIMADNPQDALQSLSAVPCPPSQLIANGGVPAASERIILTTNITITSVGFWTGFEAGAFCCSQSFVTLSSDLNASPGSALATSTAITLGPGSQPGEQFYSFSSPVTIPAGTPFWIGLSQGPSSTRNPTAVYGSVSTGAPFLDFQASCNAPPPSTGTIQVSTNLSSATFTISGPTAYTGTGLSFTQPSAPPGAYTVTFNPISGYVVPPPETMTLTSGGTVSFTGDYQSCLTSALPDETISHGVISAMVTR